MVAAMSKPLLPTSKAAPSSNPLAGLAKAWIEADIGEMIAEAEKFREAAHAIDERADIASIERILKFHLRVLQKDCEAVAIECLRPHAGGRRPHIGQTVPLFAARAICGKDGATASRYARIVRWLVKIGCRPEDTKDFIAERGGSKKCEKIAANELGEATRRPRKSPSISITLSKEAKADLQKAVIGPDQTVFWGAARKTGDKIEILYTVFGRPRKQKVGQS